jgi:glycosyltransferase involved in cell wall biosynthesis
MKYAYIKNGDAVAQVRRYLAGADGRSGPDAFIVDFLRTHPDDDIAVFCQSGSRDYEGAGRISAEAVAAPGWIPSVAVRRVLSALKIAWRVWRLRPDRIVCGCSMEVLWFLVVVARLSGVPIVNSRHGGLPAGGLRLLAEALAMRGCRGVVCHGPYLSDGVRKAGVAPARVREFEVDLSGFGANSDDGSVPESIRRFVARFPQIVMYVGRIQENKGPLDLFEAYCGLPEFQRRHVGLIYVGEGMDLHRLRNRVEGSGIDSVLLAGKVPHLQLPGVMRLASVIAAPTQPQLPEGRCMVVLESLVLGIPVVGPDIAAFPYAIEQGVNGLLFAPGRVAALRDAIARIVDDTSLRALLADGAARSGRRLVSGHLGFGRVIDEAFA